MTRERLPELRSGATRSFAVRVVETDDATGKSITRHVKFDVTANVYPDGRVGEIFIHSEKMGAFVSGALDALATIMSIALQHGVPLGSMLEKLRRSRFGPGGYTGDSTFRSCSSLFDLVAQWLEYRFPTGKLCPDPTGHAALISRNETCPHCKG